MAFTAWHGWNRPGFSPATRAARGRQCLCHCKRSRASALWIAELPPISGPFHRENDEALDFGDIRDILFSGEARVNLTRSTSQNEALTSELRFHNPGIGLNHDSTKKWHSTSNKSIKDGRWTWMIMSPQNWVWWCLTKLNSVGAGSKQFDPHPRWSDTYIQGHGSCALTKRSPCSSLLATCRVLVITSISSSLESIENTEDIETPRNKAGIQIWYPKTSQNHWFPQLRMTKNPDDLVSWLRKPPTETRAFRFQRHQSTQNLPQS